MWGIWQRMDRQEVFSYKRYCSVSVRQNNGERFFHKRCLAVLRSSRDTVLYVSFLLAVLRCKHFPVSLKPLCRSF